MPVVQADVAAKYPCRANQAFWPPKHPGRRLVGTSEIPRWPARPTAPTLESHLLALALTAFAIRLADNITHGTFRRAESACATHSSPVQATDWTSFKLSIARRNHQRRHWHWHWHA